MAAHQPPLLLSSEIPKDVAAAAVLCVYVSKTTKTLFSLVLHFDESGILLDGNSVRLDCFKACLGFSACIRILLVKSRISGKCHKIHSLVLQTFLAVDFFTWTPQLGNVSVINIENGTLKQHCIWRLANCVFVVAPSSFSSSSSFALLKILLGLDAISRLMALLKILMLMMASSSSGTLSKAIFVIIFLNLEPWSRHWR